MLPFSEVRKKLTRATTLSSSTRRNVGLLRRAAVESAPSHCAVYFVVSAMRLAAAEGLIDLRER